MSQSILTLTNVRVQPGYQEKPQVTFKANEGSDYGVVRFKVSRKKQGKAGEKAEYDNFNVELRNVKKDSKIIEFLSKPGAKVSVSGELTQEVFENNKFCKITCDSRSAVDVIFSDSQESGTVTEEKASITDTDAL